MVRAHLLDASVERQTRPVPVGFGQTRPGFAVLTTLGYS